MHSILTFEINFFLFMIFNRKSAGNREIHEIPSISINILLRGGCMWILDSNDELAYLPLRGEKIIFC
jgi:hypothetical protein